MRATVRAQACVMRAYIRVRAQDDVRVKKFLVLAQIRYCFSSQDQLYISLEV
jgi:hypothetical protein